MGLNTLFVHFVIDYITGEIEGTKTYVIFKLDELLGQQHIQMKNALSRLAHSPQTLYWTALILRTRTVLFVLSST